MTTTDVSHIEPGTTPETPDRPFGPVAAVFLAAGIAAVVLGILTTLSEAIEGVKNALQWSDAVGPLSGKTIISSGVFFALWAILHGVLKDRDFEPRKVFVWTAVLVAIGLVLTFPVFFQLFESES